MGLMACNKTRPDSTARFFPELVTGPFPPGFFVSNFYPRSLAFHISTCLFVAARSQHVTLCKRRLPLGENSVHQELPRFGISFP